MEEDLLNTHEDAINQMIQKTLQEFETLLLFYLFKVVMEGQEVEVQKDVIKQLVDSFIDVQNQEIDEEYSTLKESNKGENQEEIDKIISLRKELVGVGRKIIEDKLKSLLNV